MIEKPYRPSYMHNYEIETTKTEHARTYARAHHAHEFTHVHGPSCMISVHTPYTILQ